MKYHVGMHDFIHLGKVNILYICYNNTQEWCNVVYELNPTFFDFIDDFVHMSPIRAKTFFVGVDELEGWFRV